MRYIYDEFVNSEEIMSAEGQGFAINVRFCRDCPLFEPDGLQPDPSITKGFCHRMSDEDVPFYVDVTSNSFCNEDEI